MQGLNFDSALSLNPAILRPTLHKVLYNNPGSIRILQNCKEHKDEKLHVWFALSIKQPKGKGTAPEVAVLVLKSEWPTRVVDAKETCSRVTH